eukprot:4065706-Pyramimonas_sp.AAC.1
MMRRRRRRRRRRGRRAAAAAATTTTARGRSDQRTLRHVNSIAPWNFEASEGPRGNRKKSRKVQGNKRFSENP